MNTRDIFQKYLMPVGIFWAFTGLYLGFKEGRIEISDVVFILTIFSVVFLFFTYIEHRNRISKILNAKHLKTEMNKSFQNEDRKKIKILQKQLMIRKIILGEILIGLEEIKMLKKLDKETIDTISNKLSSYDHNSETYKILAAILKNNL